MQKLTKRQLEILEFIRKNEKTGNQSIRALIVKKFGDISRITVVRDLEALLQAGLIKKEGRGRNVVYLEAVNNKLLRFVDPEIYFKKGPDERDVAFLNFNFEVIDSLKKDIFSKEEIKNLEKINSAYQKRIKKLSQQELEREWERLTIELSWKSSRIEGNTYSLIDTEVLIKENKEAEGHKKEEAAMIINHKKTLDYIFANPKKFKKISLREIENLHSLIVKNLSVKTGLRKKLVGIVGTRYRPLDNYYQVREAMEKTIKAVNNSKDPFSKALAAILLISYIQPFEDGNKRTARLLGNALLYAHSACPLSFRSVNESDYKKAVIIFYEQMSARFFKELFVEQFKFAVDNYFLV
ncbi:Fic family protein [Patescibacteria group bacterium]|nr:Fic family protein [Patescibacteria group bacterium]